MNSEPTCAEQVFEALKYRVAVDRYGTRRYYNSAGQRHRVEGPAVECVNGDKFWYQNDLLHRDDGPAIEYADGTRCWCQNGLRHRENAPAMEYPNGAKHWFYNDRLHRIGGPAVEYANGDKSWYLHGVRYTSAKYCEKLAAGELHYAH